MKYILVLEKGKEGWEVDVQDENGVSIDGIFGMGMVVTKGWVKDRVEHLFDLLGNNATEGEFF